jgi:elongation factor P
MADTSDFRNGMVIELDGTLFSIIYFQHVKPGKGGAFVRTKLKGVMTGAVLEKTFRAGEKVSEVRLVRRPMQYSYTDGQLYYFMDMKTYEMFPLSEDSIGEDQLQYLQENMICEGLTREGQVLSVELPQFVELEIVDTDPGVKGDTARVDRTIDKYLERVS